jgi:hypothetical protein
VTDIIRKELDRERASSQKLMEENITLRGQMRDIESHYCEMYNRLNLAARREDSSAVLDIVKEMRRYIKEGSRPGV